MCPLIKKQNLLVQILFATGKSFKTIKYDSSKNYEEKNKLCLSLIHQRTLLKNYFNNNICALMNSSTIDKEI